MKHFRLQRALLTSLQRRINVERWLLQPRHDAHQIFHEAGDHASQHCRAAPRRTSDHLHVHFVRLGYHCEQISRKLLALPLPDLVTFVSQILEIFMMGGPTIVTTEIILTMFPPNFYNFQRNCETFLSFSLLTTTATKQYWIGRRWILIQLHLPIVINCDYFF